MTSKGNQTSTPTRTIRSASHEHLPHTSAKVLGHLAPELSDIPEASLSSRLPSARSKHGKAAQNDGSISEQPIPAIQQYDSSNPSPTFVTPAEPERSFKHTRWASRAMSAVSLPLCEIPERRSSISNFNQTGVGSRRRSFHDVSNSMPECQDLTHHVHNTSKRTDSPVRQALARGTQSSEALRKSPSRTFVRTSPAIDLLDDSMVQHSRFQISTRLPSPLFVGGSTVEGQLVLYCDRNSKKNKVRPLLISTLSVDVLGVESLNDGKRHVFLALAVELFDAEHPPPPALVTSQTPIRGPELLWETRSSQTIVPFCINLPLNLGPPPYASKAASIKYLLCPSATIKVGHKRVVVRQSLSCQMLTVHDPEKALGSLPSPLVASDSLKVAQSPGQTIKLTAGLHRQTWVNGGVLFLDLHIVNNSTKSLKRIDVELEKTVLFYSHAPAGTAEKSASHLRLPKRNETEVISTSTIRRSSTWKGILPQSSEIRTCELDVPRGHVTISSGRFFEVRYFVRATVSVNMFKSLAVQLPVTIIHMNSLDILPNALAQVAASIEAKRSRTVPISYDGLSARPYSQGQAFDAPRRQSLERSTTKAQGYAASYSKLPVQTDDTSAQNISGTVDDGLERKRNAEVHTTASHHHHTRHPSCYHCHIADCELERRHSSNYVGPKLPRLQVSTSGLGFSESEFEIPPDSPPRKVMLSEAERKMIRQQRELKTQRQLSTKNDHKENNDKKKTQMTFLGDFVGYHNVAANHTSNVPNEIGQRLSVPNERGFGRDVNGRPQALVNVTTPNRKRSKTNPEAFKHMYRRSTTAYPTRPVVTHGRNAIRSMDRGYRNFQISGPIADDGDIFYDVRPSALPVHRDGKIIMRGPRT